MLKRAAVIGSLMVAAAGLSSTAASAQYLPGQNSTLTSGTIQSLMAYLGYAPNDFCGFYFFVATGNKGQFSPNLIQALLPMCGTLPPNPPIVDTSGNNSGSTGGTGDTGGTGGTGGSGAVLPGGGSTGGGSTGGGSTGGGSTGGATTGGGSTTGETTDGGTGSNPFGGGGNMVTPEPLSLILLGTGLAGIGGIRASRRRRRPESED